MPLLLRRHFSPFKTYIHRDLRMIVMLNPKVGSTAFRKILVEGLQTAGLKPVLGRFWPLNLTRRYLTAPPADYLDALLHPNRYQFYCFVRNPYTRLLSAWKDKVEFGHEHESFHRSVIVAVRSIRRFAARRDLPGGEAHSRIPFATFVAFVESQSEGERNHHWDTQRSVLFTDVIEYERTYRMETEFATGMTEILGRLGLPPDWVADKVKQPQNASRKLAEPVYTAALAERVHAIYARDFEQFGYDGQSWRRL